MKQIPGLLLLVILLLLSSCLPKSEPYPYRNPELVKQDAQVISNKLEAYIKRWLRGEVPPQIPDSLVPFDFSSRKNFYLKRPQDVTTEEMWMTRYAKPVNFDSVYNGQPDPHVTYYVGASPLAPFGSKLVIEGEFPHARFFSIQVSPPLNGKEYYAQGVFGSAEVSIVDADIDPLPGNENPFRVGANRNAVNRKYRVEYDLKIGDPVALNGQAHIPLYRGPGNKRAGGLIVYQGPLGLHEAFTDKQLPYPRLYNFGAIWARTYAPDKNRDAKGGVALPKMWYELPTGEKYFIGCDFTEAKRETDATIAARIAKPAPNSNFTAYSGWGKEFGLLRSILTGVCKARGWTNADSIQRIREIDLGTTGRGENQPPPGNYEVQATINNYCSYISRGTSVDTGMVAVVTGKLPYFPNTRNGAARMNAAQIRYFSIGGYDDDVFSPLPGACINSVMDDELLPDKERRYIIAYSRKGDRPKNATEQNGIRWVDWGPTSDLALTTRYVSVGPEWAFEKSPHEKNLTWSTTDWAGSRYDPKLIGENTHTGWMGCYLPQVHLMTKLDFEALGNAITADDIPVWIDGGNVIGPNESQGKPSAASSVENATHPASAAFDGDLTTRWTSVWNGNPQWLSVDLGMAKKISGIKLYWEFTLKATSYQLQVSANNTDWTTIYTTTTGDGGIDIINNLKTSGRYVRVLMTKGTLPLYALHEMEVFSPEMNCAKDAGAIITPGEKKKLKLWPNPGLATVRVELPDENTEAAFLSVDDLKGRLLLQKSFSGNTTDIDLSGLPTAVYMISVKTKTAQYAGTFVKGR